VEQKKFLDIYNTYSKKLNTYALWLTRSQDASNDILQTVFIKIWNRDSMVLSGEELESYMYTMTRNACMDFFRKCSRFTSFRLRYVRETPMYTEQPGDQKSVWNMLDILNEQERTIVFLHFRNGFSYRTIAPVVNMNETAVRVTAFRALARLRKKCRKDIP
jgi:RNA polymerase sigma-70 factor (ECF subfamily)